MRAHAFDPFKDERWTAFVENHPRSSIFHTREWLAAIRKTYGYSAIVYTTSPPDMELTNGVVLCDIRSWLTGARLVSVPFADHCDLLAEREDLDAIVAALTASVHKGPWRYVEIRPRATRTTAGPAFYECNSYCLHALDLNPSLADIFGRLHKNSSQRKIRRAEREGLVYEEGRSDALLTDFYRLHKMTRRRHQLPPQPIEWFRNLIDAMGANATICTASRNGVAIGSIITLRHRDTLVYKYGASDAAFHSLGTMPMIFWKVICAARSAGVRELDLGRSSPGDIGLITFKDHLGAARTTSTYLKHSSKGAASAKGDSLMDHAKPLFARMPDSLLVATGKLFYRHIG